MDDRRGQTNPNRGHKPMDNIPDKLILGKTSHFVKSHLTRLPRTDEVWEADIQPMSVRGWNARLHGELWLGMVLTQLESFHLALLRMRRHQPSMTSPICWRRRWSVPL